MKPMLLARENPDLDKLPYPLYVTPKLDGIRCLAIDGTAYSRTLKPIPNKSIQEYFRKHSLHGYDGELIVGSPVSPTVFRDTTSGIMAKEGYPDFTYFAFDRWDLELSTYLNRYSMIIHHDKTLIVPDRVIRVVHQKANSKADVLEIEQEALDRGYEGVILRAPEGLYKQGRTTLRENNAFKLKRFEDSEAVVIGMEPELFNNNEAKISNTGNIERSTHKANMIPKASMGALVLRDDTLNWEFQCGSGFTAEERIWWYHNWKDVADKKLAVTYKFFNVGVKDKPRHPIFKGIRSKDDM